MVGPQLKNWSVASGNLCNGKSQWMAFLPPLTLVRRRGFAARGAVCTRGSEKMVLLMAFAA